MLKAMKDEMAAPIGEPRSSGLSPSSSRASVSSAWSGLAMRFLANVAGFSDGKAARRVDQRELFGLFLRIALQLVGLLRDLMLEHLALRQHGDEFARRHGEGAGKQTGNARQHDDTGLDRGAGDAHDQAGIGDEAVIRAEDAGAQRAAADIAMPLSNFLDGCRPGIGGASVLPP